MTNKASLLLAALLVIPAVAIAQTTPSAAPTGAPSAPTAPDGQHMRHHMGWPPSAADMAKLKADMAKLRAEMTQAQAAHMATRAKILGALTPAHKAYLASLVGQLAIAAKPDPVAATAKLDKILSASEKSKILAIHSAAMAQMLSHMKAMMPPMGPDGGNMRFRRVMVTTDGNNTETTTSTGSTAPMAGGMHRVTMFSPNGGPMMKRMHGPMTAGDILMHLAGGANMPMTISTDMMGLPPMRSMQWRHHSHPMIPAPVTPAPQATP